MINRAKLKLAKLFQGILYFFISSLGCSIFLTFFKVKIKGKENVPKYGRFILAANHQNFFDGFILALLSGPLKRITFIIAKRALKLKIYEILAKGMGFVLIGKSIEDYQKALKKLNKLLTHGEPIAIFPEGDICSKKIPRKFKGGVAKLSLDSLTKVIPIHINGTYNLRNLSYWLKKNEITITIGRPIELYNYAKAYNNNLDQMAEVVRNEIIKLSEVKIDLSTLELNSLTPLPNSLLTNTYKETAAIN